MPVRLWRGGRFVVVAAFAMGAAVSITAYATMKGAGTFLLLVPLLWAWHALSALAGTGFANAHPWLCAALAAPVHGMLLALMAWGLDASLTGRIHNSAARAALSILVATMAYGLILTRTFPLTDGL